MDLNIPTTVVNNIEENNKSLLNAIRSKFDTPVSTDVAAVSPPKFNIPLLKIPENVNLGNTKPNKTVQNNQLSTALNPLLFQQLNKKGTGVLWKPSTEIVLPQLQFLTTNKRGLQFNLPVLQPQSACANISSLTADIKKLQLKERQCNEKTILKCAQVAAIDLRSALLQTHQGTPPTRDFTKSQQINNELDFEIPFIDCDRLDVSKKQRITLPTSDEYCVTDVSQLITQHSLIDPSVIGRFLCTEDKKFLSQLPLKYLLPEYRHQRTKYNIEPFQFETKSPDDLVLTALNKYQKRHFN